VSRSKVKKVITSDK